MSNTELAHHGIKGQKWGIRRTKAQLGYKISSFKKNRAKKKKEKEKKELEKKELLAKSKPKSIKDMTDEELVNGINRAILEKRYRELNPEQISRSKKIINSVVNDMFIPAAKSSGQQFLKNYMDKIGKDILKDNIAPDEISQLKKQAEKLKLQDEIKRLKNPKKSEKSNDLSELEQKVKKAELENKLKRENKTAEKYAAEEKAKKEAKETAEREKKAAEKARKDAEKAMEKDTKRAEKEKRAAEKEAKKAEEKARKAKEDDIIDVEWREVSMDDVSTNNDYLRIGQNYIYGLLEDKYR